MLTLPPLHSSRQPQSVIVTKELLRGSNVEIPPATLHVTVISGSHLYKTGPLHKIDPYVEVGFGGNYSRSITLLRAGSDCTFNWCVTFPFDPNYITREQYKSGLIITIWDQFVGKKDDEVGHCLLDADAILKYQSRENAFHGELELVHISRLTGGDKKGGAVNVEIFWEKHSNFMTNNEGTEIILQSLRSITNPIVNLPLPILYCVTNFNKVSGVVENLIDNGTILKYSPFRTYKLRLWHVSMVFQGYTKGWNRKYKAAQQIYGPSYASKMMRVALQIQNTMFYSNDHLNIDHQVHEIVGLESFCRMLEECYVKDNTLSASEKLRNNTGGNHFLCPSSSPRFTYVVMPDSHMHFSVTSKKLAADFLSKHALHAGAAEEVVYSGEFFFDYRRFRAVDSGKPALVIDNNSGTFGPPKEKLGLLKLLMQLNFGTDMPMLALDRRDPLLSELKELNNVL